MRIKWLSGLTFSGSNKESTKIVSSAAAAAAAPSPAATNAASATGATTVTATTSLSSSTCCRQPLLTTTTTTTRTIAPPAPAATSTSTAATLLSSLTSSGKKSRVCKCCRSSNCANQANNNNNNNSGKGSSGTNSSTTTTGTKSKKGNWGLKFNCAKLRGSKSSQAAAAAATPSSSTTASTAAAAASSVTSPSCASTVSLAATSPSSSIIGSSSRLLKSESEKTDSCICTLYRKVEDLPSTVSSNNGYPLSTNPLMIPHQQIRYQHHHLDGSTSNGPGGTIRGGVTAGNQQNHGFIFPSVATTAAGAAASHHDLHTHHHPGTATTTTIIHRIDGSAAQALWGTATGHPAGNSVIVLSTPGMFDISRFNSSDDFSLEDCDERARLQRELEIREGVDAPPNFTPRGLMSGGTLTGGTALGAVGNASGGVNTTAAGNHQIAFMCTPDSSSALSLLQRGLLLPNNLLHAEEMPRLLHAEEMPRVHSQVDFIHCLVPDLQKITSCCFYWGKMDRYEAEKLLEGKPEGTFLLRDSAQEEFLFSVSFRKYNRSLHARIEQFNHKFSFDSRDPGVYTASTVTGLLEHYKDPSCVMFFEPMLTYPLNRKFVFSLQQLCRATIVSNTTYDGINELCLPKSLKSYLKEYHYRQRVRFRPLDEHLYHDL
ncbi:uncharacterized protein Socs36E isoform X2 [Ochlerotatus camptorhynchus]|uniref:uncharacterized protein Socs36E isoform X2 n=1 Tax=Ochlerotatus camptorhynchus TaxID=644619 RepID=UPI0031CED2A6